MIEPQNSLMPLVAESRNAETAQGDSLGFGEMLAQSMGLATPANPAAVQQIDADEQPQGGHTNPDEGQPGASRAPRIVTSPTTARIDQPITPTPTQAASVPVIPADGLEAGAVASEVRSLVRPGGEHPPVMPGAGPVRTLPTPPTPVADPAAAGPIDSIWVPGLDAAPDAAALAAPGEPAVANPAPDQAPDLPVVGPDSRPVSPVAPPTPGTPQPLPVVGLEPAPRPPADSEPRYPVAPTIPTPPTSTEPNREPRLVVAPADDATPLPKITRPRSGRQLPTPPSPLGNSPAVPASSSPSTEEMQHIVSPGVTPRVDLAPDSPVRLDANSPVATTPPAGSTAEPASPVAAEAAIDGPPLFTAPTTAGQAATGSVTTASADTTPAQPSALVERVMQAVDLQRTQPPPRSMVVDIPEIEGLRLVVSVRSGGQVSVAPALGSTNPDAFAPFAGDLSRVLTDRGFVMTGDDRRRGHNPHSADEQQPVPPRQPRFRRTAPIDNDLRI